MNRYILAAAMLALTSCATRAGFEKVLNSWVGDEEINLVRRWGPPAQSYEAGGHKFIVYLSQRNVYIPGVAPTYQTTVVGNTAITNAVGGSPAMNVGKSCATTFEIEGSRIVSWSYKGNDCKARE